MGNVVEVEVHHKVEADGKKAIPAPKGGGSFVAPKPEGDEKEESKSRGAIPRKGVIPLPKGHPALDGAAAKPDPGAAEKKPKAKKEKKPKAERVDKENGDANGLDSNGLDPRRRGPFLRPVLRRRAQAQEEAGDQGEEG